MSASSAGAATSACRWRSRSPSEGLQVAIYDINDARRRARCGRAGCRSSRRGPSRSCAQVIGRTLEVDERPEPGRPRSRFVVVVIGTPVDEHLNPTFHTIRRFFIEAAAPPGRRPVHHPAQHGLSRARPRRSASWSAASGRDIHVAFCPERVAEGKAMEELAELPQIVSGCDERRVAMAGRALRPDRPVDHPADAARGRADQDLHQRLALHPVRHGEPVLHDRHRLRRSTSTGSTTR